MPCEAPTASAPTLPPVEQTEVPLPRAARIFRHPFVVGVLVIGLAILLTAQVGDHPLVAFCLIAVGAALAIVKELCSAYGRAHPSTAESRDRAEDAAIICSLYAAVFGFPGIVAAAYTLLMH